MVKISRPPLRLVQPPPVRDRIESLLDELESRTEPLIRADFRARIQALIADPRATEAERVDLLNLYTFLMDHLERHAVNDRPLQAYLECWRVADSIVYAIAEAMAGGVAFDTERLRKALARELEAGRLVIDTRYRWMVDGLGRRVRSARL